MAHVTGKRKRQDLTESVVRTKKLAFDHTAVNGKKKSAATVANGSKAQHSSKPVEVSNDAAIKTDTTGDTIHIQIVTGSYERVLHGSTASIPRTLLDASPESQEVTFSDTFLFAAHASSIRCLAVSPPTEADKRILASGSSDERINVYSISTVPPKPHTKGSLPSLAGTTILENPRNKSLGSLIHHDRAVTKLHFPAKGKLFSGAEDNTIAISRTRDWTVLSSIKAPIPKAQGRPSGDTAAPGETPAGINDFAIHPSQKLMLSVGKGERCMRLWNLMTGKKAGVLNFDRDLLVQAGEGKYSSGEGRRVIFDHVGEKYVVGFERGAVVFGLDSKPQAVIKPAPATKLHQMRVVPPISNDEKDRGGLIAISTEDGRVLFYNLNAGLQTGSEEASKLPFVHCVAELGGTADGFSGRIKDFSVLALPATSTPTFLCVTASSDGAVRLWTVAMSEIPETAEIGKAAQPAKLIATLETGERITCLDAFVMDGKDTAEVAEVVE